MVVGVLGAVAQADVKRLLSFTLVSHIGFMVMGVAPRHRRGHGGGDVLQRCTTSSVQTTLFLVAGLDRAQRRHDVHATARRPAQGRARCCAVLFLVPALNLGGIPPFSGFIGKLGLFRAAAVDGSPLAYVTIGAGVVTSLLTLYALMRVWDAAFWRPKPAAEPAAPHAAVAEAHETLRAPEPAPVTISETDGSVLAGGSVTVTDAASAGGASRPSADTGEKVRLPRMMVAVTTVAVLGSVALTVVAGPLYGYATRAAQSLESPVQYVQAVLGERP